MTKLVNGKQSVDIRIGDSERDWDKGSWHFCQNGYQSIGVDISVEQFDMIKELVTNPEVVEYYETLRSKANEKTLQEC